MANTACNECWACGYPVDPDDDSWYECDNCGVTDEEGIDTHD